MKNKKYFLIVGLILLLISVVGISYAYWMQSETQKEINVVGSDCFKLTIMDESKGIELTSTHPVTDEEGKQDEGYSFTIQNVCNKIAYYQVNLEEMGLAKEEKVLSEEYIRLSLNNSDGRNITDYEEVEETIKGSVDAHKLTSGRLKPNEKVSYNLKLWMDYDTPAIEEVMNATYESKVSIIATGIEEEKLGNEITITTESKETEYRKDKEKIKITARSTNYNIIEYSYDGEVYQSITPSKEVMLEKEEMEEGTYKVYFKDEVGNVQEGSYETSKLDQTPPEIEVKEESNEEGTSLTITFTDNKSGLQSYKIIDKEEEQEWITLEGNSKDILYKSTENKTIKIIVRDQVGNEKEKEIEINGDKIGPEVTINNPKNDIWTNEKVIITIKAEDHLNGIDKIMYSTNKTEWTNLEIIKEEKAGDATLELDIEQEQTYYFKATDIYGNESSIGETTVKIDKTIPSITVNNSKNNTWTKDDLTITINATDKISGVDKFYYKKENEEEWTEIKDVSITSKNGSATVTFDVNTNATYEFKTVDQAQNESTSVTTIVKVDKTTPSITVNNPKNNTWTKDSLTVTINATDEFGEIDKSYYRVQDSGDWIEITNGSVTFSSNTNATYEFKTVDQAQNESSIEETTVKIDLTGPNIKSFTASEEWGKTNTVTGIVQDTLSGIKGYEISTNPKPSEQWTNLENVSATEQTFTKEVSENTTYYLHVMDAAGNISTKEVVVNRVDTEDPKAEFTIKESQKGLENWYKSLTVRVTATDSQSGIASGAYCIGREEGCDPQTSFVVGEDGTYDIPFENNAEAQKVCVSITDGVNRTTKVCDSVSYKVDGKAPEAKISATVDKDNIIIDATTSTDEHSKIVSYTFKLSNDTNATSTTGNYTFTKVFNGNYTVTVEVTDTAGNTSSVTSDTLEITAYHKVTYVDFEEGYTENYPQYILDGNTFEMTLKDPYPIGAKPFIGDEAVPYEYKQDTLVVNNVTGDLVIKSNYIQNIEDLVILSNRTNAGKTYENKTIYLDKDLNFQDSTSYRNSERMDFGNINGDSSSDNLLTELTTGSGFTPIGKDFTMDTGTIDNTDFIGTFNGNNHKIENLLVRKPDNVDVNANYTYGLFGHIKDSTIENLTLYGRIEIPDRGSGITNRGRAGGIVGRSRGIVTLNNLKNYAEVYTSSGRDSVGGILGEVSKTGSVTITNCNNYGNISNSNQTGGIVGINYENLIIDHCNNYGTLSNKIGTTAIGGIVANVENSTTEIKITNSNNYGKITTNDHTGSEQKVGGILGVARTSNTIIENCHNEGEIVSNVTRSDFTLNAGGILGRATDSAVAEVRNCSNIGSISGAKRGGGIVGQINSANATLKIEESYNTGNISGSEVSGGMLGFANTAGNITIRRSYNEGEITGGETGGILGKGSDFTITVTDSHNEGNITGEKDAGGIIGDSGSSATITINGSHNEGTISSENDSGGGIIGYANGIVNIESTYNQGEITGKTFAGGLIGFSNGSASTITITDSHNKGNVTGEKDAGGILGKGDDFTITVTDSHNEGNVTGTIDAGGIIGNRGGSGTTTIKNLHNEGTINSKNDSSGGIIGYANGIVNIESTYNSGSILTNKAAGGIVGFVGSGNAIINKSYNTGNLSCNHSDNSGSCGGILGKSGGNNYILNSYNEGMVTGKYLGDVDTTDAGIVGRTGTGTDKMSIINSYNIGNINGKAPNGIVIRYNNSKALSINNVYNAGELSSNGYGIGFLDSASGYTVSNVYYDSRATKASNQNGIGISKPLNDIKSLAFVQILNDNIKNIKLDDNLSGYQLVSWKMGENGFPTLAY